MEDLNDLMGIEIVGDITEHEKTHESNIAGTSYFYIIMKEEELMLNPYNISCLHVI